MLRIIAFIKTLGKNNLALREKVEKIYQESNENFLSLIDMIAEKCLNLEKYLKHDNLLDLDDLDLFSELNILKGDYRIEK